MQVNREEQRKTSSGKKDIETVREGCKCRNMAVWLQI